VDASNHQALDVEHQYDAEELMAAKPVCLVCDVEMVRGFMTDVGDNHSVNLPRWCEGDPKSSFWSGEAKHAQRNAGFKVVAYRCPTCEALRLYAPTTAD
jgi:hypothetical protein